MFFLYFVNLVQFPLLFGNPTLVGCHQKKTVNFVPLRQHKSPTRQYIGWRVHQQHLPTVYYACLKFQKTKAAKFLMFLIFHLKFEGATGLSSKPRLARHYYNTRTQSFTLPFFFRSAFLAQNHVVENAYNHIDLKNPRFSVLEWNEKMIHRLPGNAQSSPLATTLAW